MDNCERTCGPDKARTTAGRIGARTWLVVATGAMLAVAGGSSVLAQRSVQEAPRVQAPVKVQARRIAPRVVAVPALSQAEAVPPEQLDTLTLAQIGPYTVEAEEWGEIPEIGFSVQDMSGWGSQWSGNKQIFWNPQPESYAVKYDFSVAAARIIRVHLTAAPDYADLTIRLGCFHQVSPHYYQLDVQMSQAYPAFASTVSRRSVAFFLNDPRCRNADMYRLLFVAKPEAGRTFGGIDSIVVSR